MEEEIKKSAFFLNHQILNFRAVLAIFKNGQILKCFIIYYYLWISKGTDHPQHNPRRVSKTTLSLLTRSMSASCLQQYFFIYLGHWRRTQRNVWELWGSRSSESQEKGRWIYLLLYYLPRSDWCLKSCQQVSIY